MSFFERHVRPHFDQEFFAALPEAVDAACAEAHADAVMEGRFCGYHVPYVEGTARHYGIQAALIKLSTDLGARELTLRARNYPFSIAVHRRFLLIACVAYNFKNLSRSKARRYMAGLNGVLEPYQPDLFDPEKPTSDAPLFGMIIVAKPRSGALPSGIYFGVPTATLRGWHFYQEVSDLFALYNEVEPSEEVDIAKRKPRLRRTARSRVSPRLLK